MDSWTSVPEMLQAVRSAVLKLAGILIVLAIVGRDLGSAFGFAIGTCLSLWQFGQLASSVVKSVQKPRAVAQVQAATGYITRYLTVAVVLTMVYFTEGINFCATIVGLFLVKIVIVGWAVRQALREGGAAYLRQLTIERGRKGGE